MKEWVEIVRVCPLKPVHEKKCATTGSTGENLKGRLAGAFEPVSHLQRGLLPLAITSEVGYQRLPCMMVSLSTGTVI